MFGGQIGWKFNVQTRFNMHLVHSQNTIDFVDLLGGFGDLTVGQKHNPNHSLEFL